MPEVNLRQKIKIEFIFQNDNWNIVILPVTETRRGPRKYNFPISNIPQSITTLSLWFHN